VSNPLFVRNSARPWSVDATAMDVPPTELDVLPWAIAFAQMRDLEAGGIANADEQRQVGHYWLRAPELAPSVAQATTIGDTIEAIRAFAEGIRSGREKTQDGRAFTDVVHVGIGGSALGPQLVIDALQAAGTGLKVHFLDNTDPAGIARVLDGVGDRLETSIGVVVSKSGGTPETRNGMVLLTEALRARKLDPGPHLVAITGEASQLDVHAVKNGWRRRFPMWDWVGGRTSVLSAVGLLTAELAGIDTGAMLAGARDMDEWTRAEDWRSNPAALLAGTWHRVGNGKGDRAMVVLPYNDRLVLLSRYLQQLVMESLGKKHDRRGNVVHQGIVVYGNKGSTDQHAYVQQLRDGRNDFFANFVQVLEDGNGSQTLVDGKFNAGDYLQGFLLGTRKALHDSGRPSVLITVPHVDGYVLGGLIALYERAVGLYASLIDINAYHQPGVEAGKKAAADVLALQERVLAAAIAEPGTAEAVAERVGADPSDVTHLLDRLVATRRLAREGDAYRAHKAWD
jgi:glucose-6-phosphate isomerase